MKKIILFIALISHFAVSAQDDSIEIIKAPTLTAIGKPTGKKVEQKFDKDGGRIISEDGRMELIIPQDAIFKKTNISIQAVSNMLSPGKGDAYQLEPSGINFQKALQIIFHYSKKESPGELADLRGIAWQDANGQWLSLDTCVVDTIARTVTGNITHFSTWLFFDYFNLKPSPARVKVGKKLNLVIECTYPGRSGTFTAETIPKNINFTTYADNIRGGNSVVGTVASMSGSDYRNLTYTAPSVVPDNNPVAVSAEASNIIFNRRTYSKLKLVSNITVYDKAYEIKVIGYNQQQVATCVVNSIDSSSCVVSLNGKRSRLEDIQNTNVKVTSKGCRCPVTEINEGNNSGAINIEGASKIDITAANLPQKPYRVITVYFVRSVGIIPGWHAPPCGHTNDVVTPPMALPALPFVLAWEDDGKEHLIKGGDEKNGFEIRVKPVKEDQ